MAHYARVVDGVVTAIRVIANEPFSGAVLPADLDESHIQCSFNAFAGKHRQGGEPLRKNFPGVGWFYDGIGFYPPQVHPTWILDRDTYSWVPPVPKPDDGGLWLWDEERIRWVSEDS